MDHDHHLLHVNFSLNQKKTSVFCCFILCVQHYPSEKNHENLNEIKKHITTQRTVHIIDSWICRIQIWFRIWIWLWIGWLDTYVAYTYTPMYEYDDMMIMF